MYDVWRNCSHHPLLSGAHRHPQVLDLLPGDALAGHIDYFLLALDTSRLQQLWSSSAGFRSSTWQITAKVFQPRTDCFLLMKMVPLPKYIRSFLMCCGSVLTLLLLSHEVWCNPLKHKPELTYRMSVNILTLLFGGCSPALDHSCWYTMTGVLQAGQHHVDLMHFGFTCWIYPKAFGSNVKLAPG